MITIFLHREGRTARADAIDPAWLGPESGVTLWVDLAAPTTDETRVLSDVFKFHPLAVEDANSALQFPKVEPYDDYLYLVLHGIDFQASKSQFATHDVDFFLGANFLVTVHDGKTLSIPAMREVCQRNDRVVGEGAPALLHRIVDTMVDHYRPEVDRFEEKIEALEREVFRKPRGNVVKRILELKRDIVSLRRVAMPQRDVVNRLARREFGLIGTEIAYRFRDVYDHLVRLTDEALIFQDRVTGILEAHLSTISNRLNEVMKVLTVIATIFMPLTVLTGMYGMNVPLPQLPGGDEAQFWWITGIMAVIIGIMLWMFRRSDWI